jgi:NitT/TauT family transport system ATP-binding protein
MASLLEADKLSLSYGLLTVVKDISLNVTEHEFLALVGPSGSGKTSLLRILAGLQQPNSGSVLIDGKPILAPSRRCLLVDQRATLFPWMRCIEHIKFALPRPLAADWQKTAIDMLAQVGLSGFELNYPAQLSGGMKQRLALGRAIAARPEILLLDEPFSALDISSRQEISDLVCSLLLDCVVRSIVLVSHDIRDAIYCSDRLLVVGSRPASIVSEISVPFSRPRTHRMKSTPEFRQLQAQIEDEMFNYGITL